MSFWCHLILLWFSILLEACVRAFEFESSPFICDTSNFKRNYRFLQTSHASKMAPHDVAISCLLSQHWYTRKTRDLMLFRKKFVSTCSFVVTLCDRHSNLPVSSQRAVRNSINLLYLGCLRIQRQKFASDKFSSLLIAWRAACCKSHTYYVESTYICMRD